MPNEEIITTVPVSNLNRMDLANMDKDVVQKVISKIKEGSIDGNEIAKLVFETAIASGNNETTVKLEKMKYEKWDKIFSPLSFLIFALILGFAFLVFVTVFLVQSGQIILYEKVLTFVFGFLGGLVGGVGGKTLFDHITKGTGKNKD